MAWGAIPQAGQASEKSQTQKTIRCVRSSQYNGVSLHSNCHSAMAGIPPHCSPSLLLLHLQHDLWLSR